MKLTLAEARLTRIPDVLKLCPSDSRIPGYLNEAVSRLLVRGQWRGTVVRYRVCVSSGCITWPRQIETIEAWAWCDQPGQIRSHYYEFLGYGPGGFNCSSCATGASYSYMGQPCGLGAQLIDRGLTVAFDDICGTGKQIRVYYDLPVDAGKTILLQGLDSNGNTVLTDSGNVQGELITLAMPYQDSATIWFPGGLTGVQKEVTKGPVRLYEYDPATTLQRLLAVYEPDETLPEFRRSFVPGLTGSGGCCSDSTACAQTAITVLAKLKFIPVVNETDYLLISNIGALKDMCQAIVKREANLIQEALAYEASAVMELERELANYHGDGTSDPVATINTSQAGSGLQSLI